MIGYVECWVLLAVCCEGSEPPTELLEYEIRYHNHKSFLNTSTPNCEAKNVSDLLKALNSIHIPARLHRLNIKQSWTQF